jgi:hypothetical protein
MQRAPSLAETHPALSYSILETRHQQQSQHMPKKLWQRCLCCCQSGIHACEDCSRKGGLDAIGLCCAGGSGGQGGGRC